MLASVMQNVFVKIYVILRLNLIFWLFTLIGGVVLGIGPALRTVTEQFMDNRYEYQAYHFKDAWQTYKKYFVVANLHFYLFAVVFFILIYNLYLSLQIRQAWILFVQFILVFALVLTFVSAAFTLDLLSRYDTNLKSALKLALGHFFADFKDLLVYLIGIVVLVVVTKLWPGFILFITIATFIVWTDWSSRKWHQKIDQMID
ncbi:DUF624 domain-containing protein [Ligilactobacillus sp. Marseille-Q7487]|jgi:uncharacterized membrane protein YesL|uniref:YesL family protein n=1 Tax=Ligilactobacillus sp. Marseille-Q7487 TaxID=3022128 RepID=UPI0015B63DB9|nr:DUF624 domain-containing protein [Ligilactobacillus sp. Marseille-Q7487]